MLKVGLLNQENDQLKLKIGHLEKENEKWK
jgi:hypothetical protein